MRESVDPVEDHGERLLVYPLFATRTVGETAFLEHQALGVLIQFVIDGPDPDGRLGSAEPARHRPARSQAGGQRARLLHAGSSSAGHHAVRQPDTTSS